MKEALWITCGIRGNAGDALLYQVTQKLFQDLINLDFRFANEAIYLKENQATPQNVVIGPGGLFVQTNSSRHLHQKLEKQWEKFQHSRYFLWSTGILEKPSEQEVAAIDRVLSRSSTVVVRATKEAEFIRNVDSKSSLSWAPCASLFSDSLLNVKPRKKDVVVVNFDSFLITPENFADHPLRRFKAYAQAQGLEVRSMVNAGGDSNKLLLDLFPLIDIDQPHFGPIVQNELGGKEFNQSFNRALTEHPSFAERYLDCRFAFGKRLHGWLPFLAFDVPAAFIGMRTRRGMPMDYFSSDDFLCNVPRTPQMSTLQLETMADMMIEKLKFFISSENVLVSSIQEQRAMLGEKVRKQAVDFAALLR